MYEYFDKSELEFLIEILTIQQSKYAALNKNDVMVDACESLKRRLNIIAKNIV